LGWAEHILEFWIKYVVRSLIQNRKSKMDEGVICTS
jgi:hypothetical protein